MATLETKKVTDLRVVDLRAQLEKRDLDKSGIKAVLIERLQKALEEEGHDITTIEIEVTDSPVAKKATVARKTTPKAKQDDADDKDDEKEDDEGLDDTLVEDDDAEINDADLGDETGFEQDEAQTESSSIGTSAEILDETKEEDMEVIDGVDEGKDDSSAPATSNSVPSETPEESTDNEKAKNSEDVSSTAPVVEDTTAKVDVPEKEPEVSSSTEQTVESKTESETSDSNVAKDTTTDTTKSDPENKTASSTEGGSDKPKAKEEKTDGVKGEGDSESLEVLVDDTQNDLDADLKGEGGETAKATDGEEGKTAETDKTTDAAKPGDITENKTADGEKKPEEKKPDDKSSGKDVKRDERAGSRNLWVSSLSSTTRATDLKALFSKYGKVVGAKVVTNARKPGSRCYGFVTMSSAEEAAKCIQQLHRTELHGKMISVEKAKNEPGPAAAQAAKKPEPKKTEPKPDADGKKEGEEKAAEGEKKEEGNKDETKVEKKDDKKDDRKDVHHDRGRHDHHRDRDRDRPRGRYGRRDDYRRGPYSRRSPPHRRGRGSSRDRRHSSRDNKDKDKSRTVVMDKAKGEPVISVATEENKDGAKPTDDPAVKKEGGDATAAATTDGVKKEVAAGPEGGEGTPVEVKTEEKGDNQERTDKSRSRSRARKDDKKEVLTLDKIKEERERERIRQMERRMREQERRRQRELMRERQRQRDVQMKQRNEAIKLAREREKLKRERQQLENERMEAQRLERLRLEQIERDRLEREREEKRRLEQLRLQEEQQRRATKRAYDARDRDVYWDAKRPALNDRGFNDRLDRGGGAGGGGGARYVERITDNVNDRRGVVDRFDRNDNRGGRVDRGGDMANRGGRLDDRRDLGRHDDRVAAHTGRDDRVGGRDQRFDRNTTGNRDRGNDRIDRVQGGGRNDRNIDRGADRGRDDRRDMGGSNFRDNSRNTRDRNVDSRGGSDRQGGGGRQSLGARDGGRSDFRGSDRDQVIMSNRDHRDTGRSQSDVRGSSGAGLSQSGRGDNWQGGQSRGPSIQDRGRDTANKNFSRGQTGAILKNTGPAGGGSGTWGTGTQRNDTTAVNRQPDRWAGNSIVQPEARPIAYQTVGAPPGIIANVPTGMYVTTSMAPQGALMMAAPALQNQTRQQDQRFDAYKTLGANIRRY